MGTIIDILPSRFNAMNRYGIVFMEAGDSCGVLLQIYNIIIFKEMTTEKRFINFRLDGCHVTSRARRCDVTEF